MNTNTPTTAEKKDLVITRIFDAPLEKVWKAWSDADDVMHWWGPNGFSCPSAKIDFREGGTSIVCMRAPADFGGQDMYSTWAYRKIVPMDRIEYVHNLADQDGNKIEPSVLGMPSDFPQDQSHTITFKALDANKTELIVTEHDWPLGQMIEMSRMGMEQCLDKMATIFAS